MLFFLKLIVCFSLSEIKIFIKFFNFTKSTDFFFIFLREMYSVFMKLEHETITFDETKIYIYNYTYSIHNHTYIHIIIYTYKGIHTQ